MTYNPRTVTIEYPVEVEVTWLDDRTHSFQCEQLEVEPDQLWMRVKTGSRQIPLRNVRHYTIIDHRKDSE